MRIVFLSVEFIFQLGFIKRMFGGQTVVCKIKGMTSRLATSSKVLSNKA